MKFSVRWSLPVALAILCFASVAPAWAQTHVLWVYQADQNLYGFFQDVGGGAWVEIASDGGSFNFQEVSRTSKQVKLYDASRDLYIYLEKHSCSFQYGSGAINRLYPGRWVVIKS